MIEFTCIECEHKYTEITGIPEERMCNKCLREDTHPLKDCLSISQKNKKYQIQQLTYELIIFWYNQYKNDKEGEKLKETIFNMVTRSLKSKFFINDFYNSEETHESIQRYNKFFKDNKLLKVWTETNNMIHLEEKIDGHCNEQPWK